MNQDHPDEILPSYEDVIREQRRIQRSKLSCCMCGKGFICVNIFLSTVAVLGFFAVRYTGTIPVRASNITKYCNDSRYINPIPKSSYFAVNVSVMLVFALCYLLAWITSKIESYTTKRLMQTIIWKTWILGINLVFLLTFIECLKCVAGIPCPYFFSNQNITNFYCGNRGKKGYLPMSLEKLDNKLRKSFPSRRSAVYAFCTTFMYVYVDHYDVELGLHGTQQLIIMLMGSWMTYSQFRSWEQGENHVSDILVGASIGVVHAMMTVRSMFGSVFNSRIRACVTKIRTTVDFRPSTPPLNFDDPEFTHSLTNRNYESTETIFDDNTNENDRNIEANHLDTNNVIEIQSQEDAETVI